MNAFAFMLEDDSDVLAIKAFRMGLVDGVVVKVIIRGVAKPLFITHGSADGQLAYEPPTADMWVMCCWPAQQQHRQHVIGSWDEATRILSVSTKSGLNYVVACPDSLTDVFMNSEVERSMALFSGSMLLAE